MMTPLLFAEGSPDRAFSSDDLRRAIVSAMDQLGPRRRVLLIPPDFTRFHSRAGEITRILYDYYGSSIAAILPALGTHAPMSPEEIHRMFPGVPASLFRIHNWRTDVVTLGTVPSSVIREISNGHLDYEWPAQVNRLLVEGNFDLILSIGQVVPHEVAGMSNHAKNIFVGTGGAVGIHRSHYIGAVCGMEQAMGRANSPVRRVLDYAADRFLTNLPIVYIHTVIGSAGDGKLAQRGLFIGAGRESFTRAADLALQTNFRMVEEPFKKCVVWLDPDEYKSTWLGNKSIYRTRMAMADGGQLIVLAPGLKHFGEDGAVDALIRRYGYRGTPATLQAVKESPALADNLGAAAHLMHGSTEGRFSVTYCPGHLTREEIESVGYQYGDLATMLKRYSPEQLKDGPNRLADGEQIYYISNPGLGLWAYRGRFTD